MTIKGISTTALVLILSSLLVSCKQIIETPDSFSDFSCNREQGTCPENWFELRDFCSRDIYIENKNFRKSWKSAEEYCQLWNSTLATFQTKQEAIEYAKCYLSDHDDRNFWIGLKKDQGTCKKFKWLNGNELEQAEANWESGQPKNTEDEQCVYSSVKGGKWIADKCTVELNWLCKANKTFIQDPQLPNIPDEPCNNDKYKDWKLYEDFCYKFPTANSEKKTWIAANAECNKDKGTLVTLSGNLTSTSIFLKNHLKKIPLNDVNIWIGARYLISEKLVWIDNSSLEEENFENPVPEPRDGFCVVTKANSKSDMKWTNYHCSNKYHYICKRKKDAANVPPSPPPIPTTGFCPHNYIEFDNLCYNFVETPKPYAKASRECLLAGIHSREQQEFITSHIRDRHHSNERFWIGLEEETANNFWWKDNTDYGFENWNKPAGDNLQEMRCTSVLTDSSRAGKWFAGNCTEKHSSICVQPKGNHTEVESNCPPNTVKYIDSCYRIVTNRKLKWAEAEEDCRKTRESFINSHLTSINSVYEQSFFYNFVKSAPNSNSLWLGLTDTGHNGTFKWTDYRPFHYKNWKSGQPHKDREGCASITEGEQWSHEKCDEEKGFICKMNNNTYTTVPPPNGNCPNISPGTTWFDYNGNCLLFQMTEDKSETFSDAQSECKKFESLLLSITSREEDNYIFEFIRQHSAKKYIWLGLERNDTWRWLNGDELNYTNFRKDHEKKGRYATISKSDGKWETFDKEPEKLPYICETKGSSSSPTSQPTSQPTTQPSSKPPTSKVPPKKSSGMSPGGKAAIALVVLLILALCVVAFLQYRYSDSPEIRDMKNTNYSSPAQNTFNNPIGGDLAFDDRYAVP
ncbi:DgyrCDS3308 [Dimorphilus gyrociliatus]|uniref:DgyrCDS3308 n=1 Tax=Dimorphilus gyrociliatus TaxID=2664684 RepID=A0A7I8VFV0_9ANNE|nr:DgyrCDS3308 [Dimorphilus gyrociliatus]